MDKNVLNQLEEEQIRIDNVYKNIFKELAGGVLFINLLSEDIRIQIQETLRNVLKTNFSVERIRWVDDFSFFEEIDGKRIEVKEEGFLIECEVEDNRIIDGLHIILTVKELANRGWLPERDDDSYEFLKSVLGQQMWYKYPVVWGELDLVFDKKVDYEENGKKLLKIARFLNQNKGVD